MNVQQKVILHSLRPRSSSKLASHDVASNIYQALGEGEDEGAGVRVLRARQLLPEPPAVRQEPQRRPAVGRALRVCS